MIQYNNGNNMFDEVFINNDVDNLDKMARNINNRKKHYNSVTKNINNNEETMLRGIEAFSNEPNFNFSPQTNFYDKNGNYKNDFVSGLPTPLDEISDDKSEKSFTLSSYKDDSDIMESFDDLSSEYTLLPKKKKKHLRLNNEHLKEYSDCDDKSILKHIQNCKECKKHLIEILKNENINENININKKKINNVDNNDVNMVKYKDSFNYKEIKDIIILIIIGIIIIFFFDIFLRR